MEDTEASEASEILPRPSRITIACTRCRTRKARCDGKTPQCTQCIASSAECVYPAIRKTRGPGKRRKHTDTLGGDQTIPPSGPASQDHNGFGSGGTASIASLPSDEVATRPLLPESFLPTAPVIDPSHVDPSQSHAGIRNTVPIVADFLLPGTYDEHLKTLKERIGEVDTSRRLTPLLPQHIARRLIENTFTEIMEVHQLMTLPNFARLLEDQYAASVAGPAGQPARWAIVNAIIAIGIRIKTAPGSEDALSDIPNGFYQNATAFIPDLMMQVPNILSVQAFLAMAMFAQGDPSSHVAVMLVSNASRQLELIGLRRLFEDLAHRPEEAVQYREAYIIAHALEKVSFQAYSTDPLPGG